MAVRSLAAEKPVLSSKLDRATTLDLNIGAFSEEQVLLELTLEIDHEWEVFLDVIVQDQDILIVDIILRRRGRGKGCCPLNTQIVITSLAAIWAI